MDIYYVFEDGESEKFQLPEYKFFWIVCELAWLIESSQFDGDKTAGDYKSQIKREGKLEICGRKICNYINLSNHFVVGSRYYEQTKVKSIKINFCEQCKTNGREDKSKG